MKPGDAFWGCIYNLVIASVWVSLVCIGACLVLLFGAVMADGADCDLSVTPGDWVRVDAYYWHESELYAGQYYSTYKGMRVPAGVTTVRAGAEGHPTAFSFNINGTRVKQCGGIPVFHENNETGNLNRWSVVVN